MSEHIPNRKVFLKRLRDKLHTDLELRNIEKRSFTVRTFAFLYCVRCAANILTKYKLEKYNSIDSYFKYAAEVIFILAEKNGYKVDYNVRFIIHSDRTFSIALEKCGVVTWSIFSIDLHRDKKMDFKLPKAFVEGLSITKYEDAYDGKLCKAANKYLEELEGVYYACSINRELEINIMVPK